MFLLSLLQAGAWTLQHCSQHSTIAECEHPLLVGGAVHGGVPHTSLVVVVVVGWVGRMG